MTKTTVWVERKPMDTKAVYDLSLKTGLTTTVCALLLQRNISDLEEIRQFFCPEECSGFFNIYENSKYAPFLLKDMEKAVERLDKALLSGEKILIYGDYDVDGMTSTVLLLDYINYMGGNVDYLIPDRHVDGYGVSLSGIDVAHSRNVSLIITVDCGTKSVNEIVYANTLGIDVIVTDHHLSEVMPPAVAVINPKRTDQDYSFRDLSGCAVAFKFIQAHSMYRHIDPVILQRYLDLVVISIASDVVPIVNENRAFSLIGLQVLNTMPRKGLERLIKILGLSHSRLTIDDIVFKISPRLNAAGRVGTGNKTVELLMADTDAEADKLSEEIEQYNITRKEFDKITTEQAIKMTEGLDANASSIVLHNASWHKGVLGIVASRLSTLYGKPTVIFTSCGDSVIGSVRSVHGFDIYSIIHQCSSLLESYGGHAFAVGLTMAFNKMDEFAARFEKAVAETIVKQQFEIQLTYDVEINLRDITHKFLEELRRFEPFGYGNSPPIFFSRNVRVRTIPKFFGVQGNHVQLELCQGTRKISAIGFDFKKFLGNIGLGSFVDICYTLVEKEFRNETTWQVRLKEIKKSSVLDSSTV